MIQYHFYSPKEIFSTISTILEAQTAQIGYFFSILQLKMIKRPFWLTNGCTMVILHIMELKMNLMPYKIESILIWLKPCALNWINTKSALDLILCGCLENVWLNRPYLLVLAIQQNPKEWTLFLMIVFWFWLFCNI